MNMTIILILVIIALSVVFIDIRLVIKDRNKNRKEKLYKSYSTICNNCGLDFDFGDYDIKLYTDPNKKHHQITKCPRCHNYINVDP